MNELKSLLIYYGVPSLINGANGNFLSLKAEKSVYAHFKAKEAAEIENNTEIERSESIYLLQEKGFTEEQAETMTTIMQQNKPYWLQFMMNEELELPNPEGTIPWLNGLMTYFAFIGFGFIPIIPYLILSEARFAFIFSCVASVMALVLLGGISGYLSKRYFFRTVIETVLVGVVSGSIAFVVGMMFR